MLNALKPIYWRTLERVPQIAASLRSDPLSQRLRRRLAEFTGREVTVGNIIIKLSPALGDQVVSYLLSGEYEAPERRILEHALNADDVVLELGSGIGYLSTFCAKRVGNDRVFTFEANPALEPIILKNYALNAVRPNLELCMLGASHGESDFFLTRNFWSASTIRRKGSTRAVRVKIRPFNEALARIRPTFLIIDIEGGELELVKHMQFNGVQRICIELHPEVIGNTGVAQVVQKFVSEGFEEVATVSDDEHKLFVRNVA